MTYHGPGQLVLYVLVDAPQQALCTGAGDLPRNRHHQHTLAKSNIEAYAKADAPGVYVKSDLGMEAKLASLGLRIRKGCSFHGLASTSTWT